VTPTLSCIPGGDPDAAIPADQHVFAQHVTDPDDIPWPPTAYPDRVAELEAEIAAAHIENTQLVGRNETLCRELTRLRDECPLDVLRRVYGDDERDGDDHGDIGGRQGADAADRDDRRDGDRSIDVRGPGWRGWTNFR
jgi:hypothetical protein